MIFGGFYLFIYLAFDGIFSGPIYSKQDLIENYELRKSEITEVKSFIDSKVPAGRYINIEFDNGDLGIFHIQKDGKHQSNWDLDIDSEKTDSLLNVIGWTKNDLEKLESKLVSANCISASSGNPTKIGWQRSAMAKYYYNVFDDNLNDSLIDVYNKGCVHIFYKDNIVLEYGSGAFGSICFPSYERQE